MGFLRLFDLGSKGAPQRLLLVTAFLWGDWKSTVYLLTNGIS